MPTFKITVERTTEVRKMRPKEWKLCGEAGSAKYDYTPEVETLVSETTRIYEQTVDDLDFASVIRAVNNLT